MRNGWYITPASAGDYEEVEYLLFEVTTPLKYAVANLRHRINQIESELGGWGSICINGVISIVALKRVSAVVGPTCDDLDELDFGGGAFLFVGDCVDVNAIDDEDVWRSECHAVRVSSNGVYIRALARSNSHEAASDDLSALFVTVEQRTETPATLRIGLDEWPTLRAAINKMAKIARKDDV